MNIFLIYLFLTTGLMILVLLHIYVNQSLYRATKDDLSFFVIAIIWFFLYSFWFRFCFGLF